jgi:aryl-alcohol dehydrogenase-like predicted oxidoreductase
MRPVLTFRFNDGTEVRRLGYGAMRLTGQPGNFGPYQLWEDGKKVLQRALELGVNFIDTARAYGPGWNERLIAEALHPYHKGLFIATKGGVVKKSPHERYLDGSREGLRRDCEESLKNLRVDCIDLYQLHWVDLHVPLSESVFGLAQLQKEGKIRLIGLSNITVSQLEEVRSIAQIASVQNRYSVGEREGDPMVRYCVREGLAFVPYGPLRADPMKRGAPLASAEGILAEIGKSLRATATQVALSWLLQRAPNILPIPGTTSIAHLEENVAAAELDLTVDQLQQLASIGGAEIQ